MNINPSLLIGLAIAHCEQLESCNLMPGDRDQLQLRIYDASGGGFHFVSSRGPSRWYHQDAQSSDHYRTADDDDVSASISAGGIVQVTGYRFRPLATWRSWAEFEAAVAV